MATQKAKDSSTKPKANTGGTRKPNILVIFK